MKKLIINKEDLKHNINKVKDYAKEIANGKEYTIIGVVKGNGYGLDIVQYSEVLINNGINYLAVATLDEALKLSSENICNNILLLSPLNDIDELRKAIENNIIVTVSSRGNGEKIVKLSQEGHIIRTHIKIDTGFGRYGFLYNDFEEITETVKNLIDNNIDVEGIFSHFADAYVKKNKHTLNQFKRFCDVIEFLEKRNINIKLKHICNSPAFLNYPEMHLNAIRVGSAFLGRVSSENNIGLKKIGEMEVPIAEVRKVPENFSISYLNSYKTKRDSEIAILPIGHLEGYNIGPNVELFKPKYKIFRALRELKSLLEKQKLTAVINEKRYDVIGTVGMHHTVVDVTGGNIKVGDLARLQINPLYVSNEIRREYINE